MLNILLFIGLWFVGVFVCSWGVISPLIVICTALPVTSHLYQHGLIYEYGKKKANKQSAFNICFWLIVDTIVIVLLCLLHNTYAWIGFLIGLAITFLFGIGKIGSTTDNLADYVKSYNRFLPPENMDEIIKELYIYQHFGHY